VTRRLNLILRRAADLNQFIARTAGCFDRRLVAVDVTPVGRDANQIGSAWWCQSPREESPLRCHTDSLGHVSGVGFDECGDGFALGWSGFIYTLRSRAIVVRPLVLVTKVHSKFERLGWLGASRYSRAHACQAGRAGVGLAAHSRGGHNLCAPSPSGRCRACDGALMQLEDNLRRCQLGLSVYTLILLLCWLDLQWHGSDLSVRNEQRQMRDYIDSPRRLINDEGRAQLFSKVG
jgi:hypothetical protein